MPAASSSSSKGPYPHPAPRAILAYTSSSCDTYRMIQLDTAVCKHTCCSYRSTRKLYFLICLSIVFGGELPRIQRQPLFGFFFVLSWLIRKPRSCRSFEPIALLTSEPIGPARGSAAAECLVFTVFFPIFLRSARREAISTVKLTMVSRLSLVLLLV